MTLQQALYWLNSGHLCDTQVKTLLEVLAASRAVLSILVLEAPLPAAQPRKLERAWNFPVAFLAVPSESASCKTDFPTSEKKIL